MCTGCSKSSGSNKIIAGSTKKVQSLFFYPFTVGQNTLYRSTSGFLRASQRLIFQTGNSTFFISGRRIFINSLVMAFKIIFEVIDKCYCLVKQIFSFTAVHQRYFSTKHFRNFCKNGRATHGDQLVRECTNGRIGCNTGQAVRAPAFHANDQLRSTDGFPFERRSI